MFYPPPMRVEYREEACRSALNRVKGMPFGWTLNPYTGCVHRCTFCYVRAFELRADRPSDDRYGRSIRVKVNVAEVLAQELAGARGKEHVAIGAATDPYQPAEGRYRLTRACLEELGRAASPFGIITRGPLIVRDVDVLQEAARRTKVSVTFSVPTLDREVWRRRSRARRRRAAAAPRADDARRRRDRGERRHDPPGLSDRPEQLGAVVRAARAAGRPGSGRTCSTSARHEGALPRSARARLAGAARALRGAVRLRRLSPRARRSIRSANGYGAGARAPGARSPTRRLTPPRSRSS